MGFRKYVVYKQSMYVHELYLFQRVVVGINHWFIDYISRLYLLETLSCNWTHTINEFWHKTSVALAEWQMK